MEEIKVGEYVRTKDGVIDKIDHYENDTKLFHCEKNHYIDPFNYIAIPSSDVKHSKDIIDLIEVGDYVNGLRVEYITNEAIFTSGLAHGILFEDIRTIVTKEQFSNIEYRLED